MKPLFQSKMSSLLVIVVAVVLWLGCAASNQVEKAQNKSVQQMENCKNYPLVKFHVLLIKSKYQNTTLTEPMEADTRLPSALGKHTSAHEAAKLLRM